MKGKDIAAANLALSKIQTAIHIKIKIIDCEDVFGDSGFTLLLQTACLNKHAQPDNFTDACYAIRKAIIKEILCPNVVLKTLQPIIIKLRGERRRMNTRIQKHIY